MPAAHDLNPSNCAVQNITDTADDIRDAVFNNFYSIAIMK